MDNQPKPTQDVVADALKLAGKATTKFFKQVGPAANDNLPLVLSVNEVLDSARACKIKTQDQYEAVAAELQRIAALKKQVEAERVGITGHIDSAKKAVQQFFKGPAEFLADAEKLLKDAMAAYLQDLEVKAAKKAAATTDKVAELYDQADAAQRAGDHAGATKLRARAARLGTLNAAPDTKVDGIAASDTYSAQVADLMELVKAIAKGKAPIEAISANESWLNKQAQQLKHDFKLPGVQLVPGKRIAARAA